MGNATTAHPSLFDPIVPAPACGKCDDRGAFYAPGAEYATRCDCGALYDRRRFTFPPRVAKVKPPAAPARKTRSEPKCVTCGLTWSEGVRRDDWVWRDEGVTGIAPCVRCGDYTCHHCWARDGYSAPLCATCFDLPPLPPNAVVTDAMSAEERVHRQERHEHRIRLIAWRYEDPDGQFCPIDPASVWFWHEYATLKGTISEAEVERRFTIVQRLKPVTPKDAAWLPAGIYAFLSAAADRSEIPA